MFSLFEKKAAETDVETAGNIVGRDERQIPANEIAAIAIALSLYNEDYHDNESGILTIKRVCGSEWNSKSVKLSSSAYRR